MATTTTSTVPPSTASAPAPARRSAAAVVRDELTFFWRNLTLSELAGSLGDIGTLLPILVSLARAGKISATASLVFGGVFNILAGLVFRIPLCVQPMKAIAAVAVTTGGGLTQEQIMAAGFSVSAIVLVLSLTGTLHVAHRLLPHALVRGIQLGTALQFVNKGVASILASNGYRYDGRAYLDNYLIAFIAFTGSLICWRLRRNPSALLMFAYGIAAACGLLFAQGGNGLTVPAPGPAFAAPAVPSADDFRVGILNAGLGQLPLTILNSIIATSKLADDLFPDRARPVASVTAVGTSVGLMNIVGMWFGAVPYCHGSGGLAGQYRFGARTHVSVVVLGILKLVLGLAFGASLVPIFQSFPQSVLGVMLVLSGVELGCQARDAGGDPKDPRVADSFLIALITGSVVGAWANDGVGFAAGGIAAVAIWLSRRIEEGGVGAVPGECARALAHAWDIVCGRADAEFDHAAGDKDDAKRPVAASTTGAVEVVVAPA